MMTKNLYSYVLPQKTTMKRKYLSGSSKRKLREKRLRNEDKDKARSTQLGECRFTF